MPPDNGTLIEQAETRTKEANLRTDQANARTKQADLRTERAETQTETLRASELSYRRLFASARDGILILDADTGRISDVNPFLVELLGFSHDEMIGKTVGELSPFKDILSNQAMLERLQKDGYIRYEDLPLEKCDGHRVSVEFVSNVYQAGDKKLIQCNIRDITERKRTEAAMFASEARYRRLFEAAKDGILILNAATGRIVDANPFLTGLLGYAREAFIGKHLWDLGFFKDIAANEANFQELQAKQYIRYDDLPLETSDGRRIDVEFVSNTYIVEGHRVMQCNIRDITERKRAEESLRLLKSAVEQSKESIVITDAGLDFPGPKIIFVNPAFTQMTGYTAAEAIGKTPRLLQGPRTDKAVLRRLRQSLERSETFAGEAINYRKDGTEFDMEWQIAPLRNAGGKTAHFVATQHDITERKKLEAQFRQSQKMEAIGTLAGGVAHDFNNILACIQMQAGLLKRDGDLTAVQSKLADDISNAVQRAAGLTRQLLMFSRKQVLQSRDLDLNHSVNEMTKMLTRILGENIAVQLKLAAQPMFIHADSGMMDQVLMNLAVNARDAMPDGGQLVIETAGVEFDEFAATQTAQVRPGSFVRLSVSDNGCGIPPENLSKIFEPFFTTKGVGKGTGLGLATVFGITQQHHGWVNAYSEVGHGTTFKVYLPRLAESPDIKIINKLPATTQTGHETILLVEDELTLRTIMGKALICLGYRVLEASTGLKALEVWKEHPAEIHLLLTDLMMPDGMTGKELGQRLSQENPKLKVIYMSGYSADIVAKDIPLQEGVNFLIKPFPVQQLAQTIRHCLDDGSTA